MYSTLNHLIFSFYFLRLREVKYVPTPVNPSKLATPPIIPTLVFGNFLVVGAFFSALTPVVGASVVGASVTGAAVVGASVVGASVVGASVVGVSAVDVSTSW